jgi:hypothetical protein
MARIRTIKPELPSDPSLAKCSRDARLTFTYLITQSDDYGFVPAAPRQIVGLLFPHDDDIAPADVGRWVDELVAVGLCEWAWTTDGLPLVRLSGWETHQRIDNRRKAVLSARLAENRTEAPPYANCDVRHAEVRREPAAIRREIPLEPPTSDHGPRTSTSDLHSSRSVEPPTDRVNSGKAKAERKYPHFPHDLRAALYERWREKGGVLVEFPRFVREVAVLFDRPEAEWGFTRQEAYDAILIAREWALATDRIARNNFESGNLTPGRWAGAFRSTHLPNVRMGTVDRDGIATAFGALIDRSCAAVAA